MKEVIVRQSGTAVTGQVYIGTTSTTIQTAINYVNSNGGGKVFIEKGVYTISTYLTMYSNIEICGEGVLTKLQPSYTTTGVGVINMAGTSDTSYLSNIHIHDLYIGNSTTKVGTYGIFGQYVGKETVDTSDSTYSATSVGNTIDVQYGITINNCFIQNPNANGIHLLYAKNVNIYNNTITNTANVGINCSYCTGLNINNNIVQFNSTHGIAIDNSSNNIVSNNTIQNNTTYGIYLNNTCVNTNIINNYVHNNSSIGIYLTSSPRCLVSNNSIQNNSGTGIQIYSSQYVNVTKNMVQNNNTDGIKIQNSSNSCIQSNTIQFNSQEGVYFTSSSSYCTLNANVLTYNSTYDIYIDNNCNSNTMCGNIYASIYNYGSYNVFQDNYDI